MKAYLLSSALLSVETAALNLLLITNCVPISQRCAPLLVRTFTAQTVKQNTDWPEHKRSLVSVGCPTAVQKSCCLLYCKCKLLSLEREVIASKDKFPIGKCHTLDHLSESLDFLGISIPDCAQSPQTNHFLTISD
jgi:hypothetical protein